MAEIEQMGLFEPRNPKIPVQKHRSSFSDIEKPGPNTSLSHRTEGGSRQESAPAEPTPRDHRPALPCDDIGQEQGLWTLEPARSDLLTLAAVSEAVANCTLCKLSQTRHNTVSGEGNPQARIMFVGEGPGREEDAQGLPFVGAAGRLLDKLLISMDLTRTDVFIGNVIKCRPPRNRDPELDEVRACMPYLARQIELINPDVMIILGATALRALIDPKARITAMRGTWLQRDGIMVMPTFHPAALLRDPSKKLLVWEDMKKVLQFLDVAP